MKLFILFIICVGATDATRIIPDDILSRYPGQDDYINIGLFLDVFLLPILGLFTISSGPTTYLEAVGGHNAHLPCNMTSPMEGDHPLLVLWYKSGVVKPIYSYDMRNRLPTHWKNEKHLGNRGSFDALKGELILQRVMESDESSYRCRVDFRDNPTLTYAVNLTVIIPPKRLWIVSEDGEEVSENVGPYMEGDRVLLTCKVSGGNPAPQVVWKERHSLLDNVIERTRPQLVANTLMIEKVTRRDLLRAISCIARNTDLVSPLQSTVTIDMIFPPLEVRLVNKEKPFSAGRRYETECQVIGSRPKADVEFTLDGRSLLTHSIRTNEDGNVTVATLLWTPKISDSGRKLGCRASSPAVEKIFYDSITVVVHYVPQVNLQPGRNLDLSNIEEGDDIYFECIIKSDPPVYKVVWILNDKLLQHNVSEGIIISNQSLVLQSVERNASGKYACHATNSEGVTSSNIVELQVKYAPVCHGSQTMLHGAARHEQVHIPCLLEAHPKPSSFIWTFNNSGESVKIPEDHVKVESFKSIVSYTPMTELDYGTLLCWGRNAVGSQINPCVFHVFPAGRPDPVFNCSQFNLSDSAVNVRCSPGFDGGLPQTFVLELYDNYSSRLIANVTSLTPILSVSELDAATSFAAVVYSTNEKGSGELFRLQTYTLKDNAEKRTAAIKPAPASSNKTRVALSPILLIALGAVGGLLLVALIIIVAIRIRFQRVRESRKETRVESTSSDTVNTSTSLAPVILKKPLHQSYEAEDINPELISHAESSAVWRNSQVHTISTSSMIGSFATLPRKISGQGVCQSFNSAVPYAELGLSRAPSLQSTCIRHGDPIVYTSLEPRRMSQPLIIPPPPPEFASSENQRQVNPLSGVQAVWKVRSEDKNCDDVEAQWLEDMVDTTSVKGCFKGSRSCEDEMKKALLKGQHESSV